VFEKRQREGQIDFRRSCRASRRLSRPRDSRRWSGLFSSWHVPVVVVVVVGPPCTEKRKKKNSNLRIFRVPKIATRSYVSAVFRQWPGLLAVFNSGDAPRQEITGK
jgi:hypothetical protein